ncbi:MULTISPECIES: hypothetical protein [unclassified Microbacterium]|uniref:hypothetical protein n=1 Tax=unclassified Microbacterium TaxID=2609290 RepID=UPI0012F91271|nr:hypothetical protein [Microbacterium sp. MAH-37]MVQ41429.1 hypothetical protein [Microbacterium sp. MAH-37]
MTDQSIEIRELRARVDVLERMLVGTYALIVGVVLVLGLTLPLATTHAGGEDQQYWSVITTTLAPLNGADSPWGGIAWLLMTLLILMIIITVLLLALTLIPAARRSLSDGLRVFGIVLTALGTVGAVAIMAIIGASLRTETDDFGWGGPVLLLGMIAVLPLLSGALRSLVGARR